MAVKKGTIKTRKKTPKSNRKYVSKVTRKRYAPDIYTGALQDAIDSGDFELDESSNINTEYFPNKNRIPYFDRGYAMLGDTPPMGLREIPRKIKESRKYRRDRLDFAYKHHLMVDSEVEERYWTKDGMFYIDVNIYDDIERRNALDVLYAYRRNQSVNQATPALFRHKQSLKKKGGFASRFNPDALRALTGDYPTVVVVDDSGKRVRSKVRHKKKIVDDDDPLAYFINNARVTKTKTTRKKKSNSKTKSNRK